MKRISQRVPRSRNGAPLTRDLKDNIEYYLLMAIPLILIFIFSYLPMAGLVIAFQDYSAGRPFFGEGVKWAGLKHFEKFVGSYYFTRILKNTVVLNILSMLLGFWVPIAFALVVNEIRNSKFRKFTQTVSYMPNFISSVVVAGMFLSFIASDGVITQLLRALGFEAKSLNANKEFFPWFYTFISIWKSFGWSSIIYLSTITSIDPGLYESAELDGCGRLQKIWYITLPHMMPLIMIQLIFTVGNMLTSNSDMILLLYNPSIYETADVIGTYNYRVGLMGGQYSYGTAAGLLLSIMSFALVYIANRISRKYTDYSLW